jgi:organic radical activating enzyme
MTFCPMILNNIEISSSGFYKPCCISSKKFEIDGKHANAHEYTLPEIMEKSDRTKWIENFSDEDFKNDCKQCYSIELAGGDSKRTREIREWTKSGWLKFEAGKLQSLDLKLGNTCNLMCAICAPNASSKWGSFYRSIGIDPKWGYQRWPDTDEFWEGLNTYAHDIQKIELAGGEPFMIKKQEKLIKFLIERDLAKNIDITWISNSTIWPENIVKYFSEFKYVRIMLSMDNTHEQFEYIRYPAKWDTSYEVFKRFKELHDNDEINLGISYSIGFLNAYRAPEFHAWAREHKVNVFNNMVLDPYSVRDYPLEYKLKVKEKLEQQTDPSYQGNPIVGPDNWFVQFMMQESKNDVNRVLNTFVKPSRPDLNIKEVFPELREVLEKYE